MPNLIQYVIALFLLASGGVILVLILLPVVRSFSETLRSVVERSRLQRGSESLKRVDQLLEEGNLPAALSILKQSVILETVSTREGIRAVREHNQQILTRFIEIGEEQSVHLDNLAEVEQLFLQHVEMQLMLMKAAESFSKLQSKGEQDRRTLQEWTKSDFQRRVREIQQELRNNRARLEQVVKEIVSALETRQVSDVTYH